MKTSHSAKALVEKGTRSQAMERLARAGYVAKGIVYGTIGLLALGLALGKGGEATGTHGAIERLAQAPFGKLLLWVVAIGLLGLVAWRFVQALKDTEGNGGDGSGALTRVGLALSGIVYAGLLAATVRTLTQGSSGGSNEEAPREWTARVMDAPFGRIFVALAGVVILAYGVREIAHALKSKFERKLRLDGIAARQANLVRRTSQFGLIARGFIWALIGSFVLQSAIRHDPSQSRGLGETLATLAKQPFGSVLLAIVALGLLAYAVYSFVEARYRKMNLAR